MFLEFSSDELSYLDLELQALFAELGLCADEAMESGSLDHPPHPDDWDISF